MSQTQLTDAIIRHQIFIQRYGGGINKAAQDELDRILGVLLNAVADGTLTGFQRALVENLFDGIVEIANSGATELLEPEANWNSRVLAVTAAIEVTPSTSDQLTRIFNNTPATLIQGKAEVSLTPAQMSQQYSSSQAAQVLQTVRDGLITGKTNREIQDSLTNLVNTRSRNQTEAFVRTMVNQAANVAKVDTYNLAGIAREEYVAVLDRRTTVTCASLDSNIYAINDGPRPPMHYRCRSVRVPLLDDSDSANVSEYGNWLKRQPKATQVEVLGEERAALFRSGELTIEQFTDDRGVVYSLDELERLYDVEIE